MRRRWTVLLLLVLVSSCTYADDDEQTGGLSKQILEEDSLKMTSLNTGSADQDPDSDELLFDGATTISASSRGSTVTELGTGEEAVTDPALTEKYPGLETFLSRHKNLTSRHLFDLEMQQARVTRDTIRALLPRYKAIQKEFQEILNVPHETVEEFQHESQLLEKRLQSVDSQMHKSRSLQDQFSKAGFSYRSRWEDLHSYLGQILDPDLNTAEEEHSEYLTPQPHMAQVPLFQLPNGTQSPQELVVFVRGVTDPQQRLLAYEYAVEIINQDQRPDPILLQILADIYKTPALVTLEAKISSETLQNIFSPNPKKLYNRQHSRVLTMDGSRVATGETSSNYRAWNFQQVGDTEYFLIVNTIISEAVGLEPQPEAPPNAKGQRIGTSSVASARTNERYHWKISYLAQPDALTFLNRHLDLTLDGNVHGHIYPHVSNFNNGYQQWRLVL